MGTLAASGLHMLAIRSGFASCARTTSAHLLILSGHKMFAIWAMSQSGMQGLPIDIRGKVN
jgi:hypothetical protein